MTHFVSKTDEEFDAMHDAAFCDWWDEWMERHQKVAVSEDEVEAADQVRKAAFDRRFGE